MGRGGIAVRLESDNQRMSGLKVHRPAATKRILRIGLLRTPAEVVHVEVFLGFSERISDMARSVYNFSWMRTQCDLQ